MKHKFWQIVCYFRGHEPAGPTGFQYPIENHYCKYCKIALFDSFDPEELLNPERKK